MRQGSKVEVYCMRSIFIEDELDFKVTEAHTGIDRSQG